MKNYSLLKYIDTLIEYIKKNNFEGYSKFDALNSPILHFLSFDNKWLRLLFTQIILRFPINLRPALFVKKSKNPKGIALFARAFLTLYKKTHQKQYKNLGIQMLSWLERNHSNVSGKFSGYCWGYNFIWQSPFFYAPNYYPNQTVTSFVGEAFVLGYKILKERHYLDIAKSSAEYIMKDLPILYETDKQLCIGYVTNKNSKLVININVMAASFLSKLYKYTHDEKYKQTAIRLTNFVVENMTFENTWTYTTDSRHSYVDNYHTTGIMEQLFDVMVSLNLWKWLPNLNNAIDYYINNLLTENFVPKWRNNKIYPIDIHGCASAIIMFSKFEKLNKKYKTYAKEILKWTLNNMYNKKKYFFYYQKYKYYTKKFTFMRWSNAWMLVALSEFL